MATNQGTPVLDPPKTPAEERQDVATHHRALFRGRAILGVGVGLLVIFGTLMALIASLDPQTLDVPITREVQKLSAFPILDSLLADVSLPGFGYWAYVFPLAIVFVLLVVRRIAEAAFMVLAAACTASADLVKLIVHRARPTEALVHVVKNQHLDGSSFPSSHVVEYTLVFGFSFYLIFTLMKHGVLRAVLLTLCAAMVILIGPSRIDMGQHWVSDVFGGYTLGFGLLLAVIWAYRGWEARRVEAKTGLPEPG